MGYYMDMIESRLWIKKENENKALKAIKNAVRNGKITSWIIERDVEKSDNLQDAMTACRWEIEKLVNDNGYGRVYFDGEKLGDDYQLFEVLAPFVEDGSYIEMSGEDGCLWRWVFENGKCKEIYPNIIW